MEKMAARYHVGVMGFLYEGAIGEDGEPAVEESFRVLIEDEEEGHRWLSNRSWTTEESREGTRDADGRWHYAIEGVALRHVRIVEKVLAEGKVDPRNSPKWSRTSPCYGSKAYEAYGQAEDVMWEKKEAEMGR